MLNKLKQLYKAFQAYKKSEMGDFAWLKFDAIAPFYLFRCNQYQTTSHFSDSVCLGKNCLWDWLSKNPFTEALAWQLPCIR